jgi:hypothetical protein
MRFVAVKAKKSRSAIELTAAGDLTEETGVVLETPVERLVTRPKPDGRYAIVETTLELAVGLEPELGPAALSHLLEFAEPDCFTGSSSSAAPRDRWTLDSRTIGS